TCSPTPCESRTRALSPPSSAPGTGSSPTATAGSKRSEAQAWSASSRASSQETTSSTRAAACSRPPGDPCAGPTRCTGPTAGCSTRRSPSSTWRCLTPSIDEGALRAGRAGDGTLERERELARDEVDRDLAAALEIAEQELVAEPALDVVVDD